MPKMQDTGESDTRVCYKYQVHRGCFGKVMSAGGNYAAISGGKPIHEAG